MTYFYLHFSKVKKNFRQIKKIGVLLLFLTNNFYSQNSKKLSVPEKDFEKFWLTFKDNYAFFELKGVNWDSSYSKFRPLITKNTNQKELISVMAQMVDPLKDSHITISKGEEILYKSKRPSYFRQEFKGQEKEFWQTVKKTLADNNFQELKGVGPVFKEEHLYYVSKNKELAYIRITRCFGEAQSLFDDKKELTDTKLMLHLFDSLLAKSEDTKAMIIDLRGNGGGHAGLELASRFIQKLTLTHYRSIRQKRIYTSPEPQYLYPNPGITYLKQLIILTNDRTASSAEDFTISLYKQNNVTTLGANTSGMLSDMYSGELSNKLSFTLSNQVYYSTDKDILEDKGVPVKIEIKNSMQDIKDGIDPVILKAIQMTE